MIGPLFAALVALAPLPQTPIASPPQVQEECVDAREYVTFLMQRGAVIQEVLKDTRVNKVTDTVRNLTNALDDYIDDPDSYVILTTPSKDTVILIPLYGLCVSSPLYMRKEFYENIRGVPLAPTREI